MSQKPKPVIKSADDINYDPVGAADGMTRGVLIGEEDGAPNFAIRRFVLESGATVPKHTNDIEHVQYVLEGKYTVGIADEEYVIEKGDSLLIPAGVVHWYRNESDTHGAFLCGVPHGDDEIKLQE